MNRDNFQIDIKVGNDNRGTVTTSALATWRGITGEGQTICNPKDHYVQAIGEGIAVGRALQALGTKMIEIWDARVVTKADLSERRGKPIDETGPIRARYAQLAAEHEVSEQAVAKFRMDPAIVEELLKIDDSGDPDVILAMIYEVLHV